MIGLVAVSHSRPLAEAAVDLAQQMLHGAEVRMVVAAGLDEKTLGTDAVAVAEAITLADSGDGVLVLMDLGSAVLSAELAIDLLETPHEVRLCPAPFIEGMVAATVAAAGGMSLAEAAQEAQEALAGKQTHLGVEASVPDTEQILNDEPGVSGQFVVDNPHGLHARPAARLVAEVRGLPASVSLRNRTTATGWVSAKSLSRVAALGARRGDEIQVEATGPGAQDALDRVLDLAANRFDEMDEGAVEVPQPLPQGTGPYPASEGIGIGPVWRLGHQELVIDETPAGSPRQEREALDDAIDTVAVEIERTRDRAGADAEIFGAHLFLLEDDELLDEVHRGIDTGKSAAAAWQSVLESAAGEFDRLPDEYQRARAADLRAVRDQVLAVLLGHTTDIVLKPGILAATDLTPAQAVRLDPEVVTGIVLTQGSATSHSAILARSRGIPAVVGAGREILSVAEGTMVALDGGAGRLVIDPGVEVLTEFTELADRQQQRRRAAEAEAGEPAVTRDGVTVHVAANVGGGDAARESAESARAGADLAGLVRTEFLFLDRDSAPSVDEQEQVYRSVAEAFDGRRIVLRTLDVGGDKPLPYIMQAEEANPFLGVRGIRLTLLRRELLRDQLTAIGRVAADHPVSVMFPMVTQLDELRAAREILDEVLPEGAQVEVGIMVEVPATAAKTSVFAEHVDFFSIGTNDLTQYALAAERGNDALSALADVLDPGVLRLIAMVCADAGTARVAVCGEAAADRLAAPVLLGLGVDELSVSPPAIALTKAAVRELDSTECRRLADKAVGCADAGSVRAAVAEMLS